MNQLKNRFQKLAGIQENNFEEMKKWFFERTKKHIDFVQDFCSKIENYDNIRFKGLTKRGKEHDKSKYLEPEFEPYIFITWDYKCKRDGTDPKINDDMREQMNKATSHHVLSNRHHPEFHDNKSGNNIINRKDRDKPPEELINATKMSILDIAEMCADWMAMSKELDDIPQRWAKNNINVRWKFNEQQEKLIYEILNNIWENK